MQASRMQRSVNIVRATSCIDHVRNEMIASSCYFCIAAGLQDTQISADMRSTVADSSVPCVYTCFSDHCDQSYGLTEFYSVLYRVYTES